MSETVEDVSRVLNSPKIAAYAVAINPEPWAVGSISVSKNRQTGKMFPTVAPEPTLKNFQEALQGELDAQGAKMTLGAYSLRFHFSRQLVTYKRRDGSTATRNWADVTNMQKATEDALQGVVIGNDRDVRAVQSKLVGPQGAQVTPYVLIELGYGIDGYTDHELELPGKVSEEGLDAMQAMYDRLRVQEHIVDNDWEP